MTLNELIDRHRLHLEDETIGVRRSWEDTFRYALKFYPQHTPLEDFDLHVLAERMAGEGINSLYVDGYIKRWRDLLSQA